MGYSKGYCFSVLLIVSIFVGLSLGEDPTCLKDLRNVTAESDQIINVNSSYYNYFYTPTESLSSFVGVQYKVSGLCTNFTVFVGDGKSVFCPNSTSNDGAYESDKNGTATFLAHFPGSKGYYFSILVIDKDCNETSFQITAWTKSINTTNSTIPDVCNVTDVRNCTQNGASGKQRCYFDLAKNSTQWSVCELILCLDKSKTLKNGDCVPSMENAPNKLLPVTIGFIIGGVILAVLIVGIAVVFEYTKLNNSRKGYTIVE